MGAFVIDAFEFCRLNERREGDFPVAGFARLSAETADQSGIMHWSLRGGKDKFGHAQLTLSLNGGVKLICQRCLSPFALEISLESVMVLAKTESEADEIDENLEEQDIDADVIVVTKALDIAVLVEDEVLLGLPLSPRHEICLDQNRLDSLEGASAASPFAALKNLKGNSTD